MKIKRAIPLLCALGALILELTPWGAVCNFALDAGETLRQTFSYFDPVPFGYANFGPFLTGILTCLLILLTLLYAIFGRTWMKQSCISVGALAAFLSVTPIFLGLTFYSVVGLLITLLLAGCAAASTIVKI
ncbi:MAG: hypothetical protein IJ493_09825 [Clostridia bacterium]|nr:hypothetical protein [Clostridia bacterium]